VNSVWFVMSASVVAEQFAEEKCCRNTKDGLVFCIFVFDVFCCLLLYCNLWLVYRS